MDGIDKITARIRSNAKAESDAVIAEAKLEVEEMLKVYEKEAVKQAEETARRGELKAAEHYNRREAIAELEARKKVLEAKQEMLDIAFNRVTKAITSLPVDMYIEFLSRLAARNSRTGIEQVLLTKDDREKYGAQVLLLANGLLAAEEKHAGMSLSDETADIDGGLILRDGDVEVNCTIGVILQLIREEISGEVANVLFS